MKALVCLAVLFAIFCLASVSLGYDAVSSTYSFSVQSTREVACVSSLHSYHRNVIIETTDNSHFSVTRKNGQSVCSTRQSSCSTQGSCIHCSSPTIFVIKNDNYFLSAAMRVRCFNLNQIRADTGSLITVPEKATTKQVLNYNYDVCEFMSSVGNVRTYNNDSVWYTHRSDQNCKATITKATPWTWKSEDEEYDANERVNARPHGYIKVCSSTDCVGNIIVSKKFEITSDIMGLSLKDKKTYVFGENIYIDWGLNEDPNFHLILFPNSGDYIAKHVPVTSNPAIITLDASTSSSGKGYIIHCKGKLRCKVFCSGFCRTFSSCGIGGTLDITSGTGEPSVECEEGDAVKTETFDYTFQTLCWGKAGREGCSGNGNCVSRDTCSCDNGWGGDKCQFPTCWGKTGREGCSGNGNCVSRDNCTCDSGYRGEKCQITPGAIGIFLRSHENYYPGENIYIDWGLNEDPNFHLVLFPETGDYIAKHVPVTSNPATITLDASTSSSGKGYIIHCKGKLRCRVFCSGVCRTFSSCGIGGTLDITSGTGEPSVECIDSVGVKSETFFFGSQTFCWGKAGREGCSGNGNCVSRDTCSCDMGWTGDRCQSAICWEKTGREGCSGNGNCILRDYCSCDAGWKGSTCSIKDKEVLTVEVIPKYPMDHYGVRWYSPTNQRLHLHLVSNETSYHSYLGASNTGSLSGKVPSPLKTGQYSFMHCGMTLKIENNTIICSMGGTLSQSFHITGYEDEEPSPPTEEEEKPQREESEEERGISSGSSVLWESINVVMFFSIIAVITSSNLIIH